MCLAPSAWTEVPGLPGFVETQSLPLPPARPCGQLQLFPMGLVSGPCDCLTPSCDCSLTPCRSLTSSLIAPSSGPFEEFFTGA